MIENKITAKITAKLLLGSGKQLKLMNKEVKVLLAADVKRILFRYEKH
jgi:hypothetical protein